MEELRMRYEQLVQAYDRLYYMVSTLVSLAQEHPDHYMTIGEENELVTHRDAVIKRFEICYDVTWKYLKLVLNKKFGLDVASPLKVFKESYTQNILTTEESQLLVDLVTYRNETTHVYDESKANKIVKTIIDCTQDLIAIIKKINPNKIYV